MTGIRALAAGVLAAMAWPCAAAVQPAPEALYGGGMLFAVWRSGSEIGTHTVTFSHRGDRLIAVSVFDIAIKVLGITVYRYRYRSQEEWADGRLAALAATIDDDGKQSTVAATPDGAGKLHVVGPSGTFDVALPILPSTHWNPATIGATRVLNTLNGKEDAVKLVPQGVAQVVTAAGPVAATHYVWHGDIKAESWYDAAGHWVKLRFPGTDGTPIEYVCQRCSAAAPEP